MKSKQEASESSPLLHGGSHGRSFGESSENHTDELLKASQGSGISNEELDAGAETPDSTCGRVGCDVDHDPDEKDNWKRLKEHVVNGDVLLLSRQDSASNASGHHPDDNSTLSSPIKEMKSSAEEFTLRHCLLAIFLYMVIAIISYKCIFERDWTIIDCCYFAVVTFSTVGYGDIYPSGESSMIFTCFYAILGVILLGNALGVIGSNLLEAQERAIDAASDLSKLHVLSAFDDGEYDDESTASSSDIEEGGIPKHRAMEGQYRSKYEEELKERNMTMMQALEGIRFWVMKQITDTENIGESSPSVSRCIAFILMNFVPVLFLIALAWMVSHSSGEKIEWDVVQTAYYLVITACTIGYGDMTPHTQIGKLTAITFILLACGAVSQWIGALANSIIKKKSEHHWRSASEKDLTEKDLEVMDVNGDGNVTRAEFMEFVLVAMGKIDREMVAELRSHFDRLDFDNSGTLSRDDLIKTARRKLKCPKRKLELAQYKSKISSENIANNQRAQSKS